VEKKECDPIDVMSHTPTQNSTFADCTFLIPPHTGKTSAEIERQPDVLDFQGKEVFTFAATLDEVESLDYSRMMDTFGPNAHPDVLRRYKGKVRFTISGYEHLQVELYEIPVVREYYRTIHHYWPCWPFFAERNSGCLALIAACIVPSIGTISFQRDAVVTLRLKHNEVLKFFGECILPSFFLHALIGEDEHQRVGQLLAVAEYLQVLEP